MEDEEFFKNMDDFEKAIKIHKRIKIFDFNYSTGIIDLILNNFYLKQIINDKHKYLNCTNMLQLVDLTKKSYFDFDIIVFVTDDSWLMISGADFQIFLNKSSIDKEILERENYQGYSGSLMEFPKTPIFIATISEELFALITLNLTLDGKGGFIYG